MYDAIQTSSVAARIVQVLANPLVPFAIALAVFGLARYEIMSRKVLEGFLADRSNAYAINADQLRRAVRRNARILDFKAQRK